MASNTTICANTVSTDSLTVNKVSLYKNLAIACADSTDALTLTTAQSGGTILGALTNNAKTINLPAAEVGLRYKFIQTAAIVAGGDYTIQASVLNGDTFTTSSYVINQANAGVATSVSPVAANNKLEIIGENTDSVFGVGSTFEIVCVAPGEWELQMHSLPTGAGGVIGKFTFGTTA